MSALRRVKRWLRELPPDAVAVGATPLSLDDLRALVALAERADGRAAYWRAKAERLRKRHARTLKKPKDQLQTRKATRAGSVATLTP